MVLYVVHHVLQLILQVVTLLNLGLKRLNFVSLLLLHFVLSFPLFFFICQFEFVLVLDVFDGYGFFFGLHLVFGHLRLIQQPSGEKVHWVLWLSLVRDCHALGDDEADVV